MLLNNEVHVWLADFSSFKKIDSYRALLNGDEFDRLRQDGESFNKMLPLLSRALLRKTLSRYRDVPPQQWKFNRGAYGKPEIANFEVPFFFNVSHSAQLAVCAICEIGPIGVDLERTDRICSADRIAHRFFAQSEVDRLLELTDEPRRRRFFELWTLKEAYLKAKGVGLTQPLNSMSFFLKDDGTIAIQFVTKSDDPACWAFSLFEPCLHYQLALAVQRPKLLNPLNIRFLSTDAGFMESEGVFKEDVAVVR